MEEYHFVKNCFINAPIEIIWKETIDVKSYPIWWLNVKKVAMRGKESRLQKGSTIDFKVKGILPYTFHYTIEVREFRLHNLIEVKSIGDFVGMGKLILEPRDNGTFVKFCWYVKISKTIINHLAKLSFFNTLLLKNHDHVIKEAFRGLKARIEVLDGGFR